MADASVFDLAEKRLAWLDRRQGLLAQNIANANTPGYQARDLAPFALKLSLAEAAATPMRTDPLHLAGTVDDGALALTRPAEHGPDGNAVPLDTQLTEVADTDASQELVTDLYKKYMNLFRTALGR